jgi:hypothetical protein
MSWASSAGGALDEFGGRDHTAQSRHLCAQQPRERARLGHRDQHRGRGIVEDARMTTQVLLDLCRAQRRVNRHRDAARQQHANKTREVLARGRQHERRRLARPEFELA